MVKLGSFLVCLLITALDVAAGICGIEAEAAQNKAKHLRVWLFECKEPSHKAYMLGLAAIVLLVVTQTITTLLGGWRCIFSKHDNRNASRIRQISTIFFFFLTWIIVVAGLALLVIGTRSDDKSKVSCGFTNHHMMFIGGILCFVHGVSCVAYYVSATAALS